MANIIPLKDSAGAQFYPQTHEKAVVDSNGVNLHTKLQSITTPTYVTAWDGASTPVVANIPAGVSVTYNTTTYTGTLAASASTANKTYLVSTGTTDNYNRYVTQLNGSTYSWQNLGSTEIDLSDYATKEELGQLDQKFISVLEVSDSEDDLQVGDDARNIILSIANGVVKTKAFDSSKLHTVPDNIILCVGDSLTMGTGSGKIYPLYLQKLVGDDYAVDNLGEGGDKIQDIMARTNAFPAVTAGAFTIPASGSVSIGGLISSYDYARNINLLKQSQAVFNPVEIMGVKGYLAASGNYEAVTYTFTRLFPGTAVNVPKWTPVYGKEGLYLTNSKILILWGGQNGLFSDEDELVSMDKAIIDKMGIADYCVIGPTNRAYHYDAYTDCHYDYEVLTSKMRKQFGCRYIDMLGYLLTDALTDAGITPTTADTNAIANDMVPPSLLADNVHFNATGFELVANKIYEVLKQLNYL